MTTDLAPAPAPVEAPAARPRIFSGIQPSGAPHIGNDLGRHPQLRQAPVGVRGDLLHRRLPRADEPPRPGPAAAPDARDGRRPARPRPGPGALHAVRPEPPTRAHRARLAAHDRHPGQLAGADADVQGEAPEPARRHQPRAADLPGPAGRRHRHLQGVAGARRQGPGRPPGADPRDRPQLQQPLRRDVPGADGRPHRGADRARAPTASGR